MFFAAALAASVALAGCGRRGPLELPPGSVQAPQSVDAAANNQAARLNDPALPGLVQSPNQYQQSTETSAQLAARSAPRPINAPPVSKPSSFFLDPLL